MLKVEGIIMKALKKVILGTALVVTSATASAADLNVGGVIWDPDWVNGFGNEMDFIAQSKFTQWYSETSDARGSLGSVNGAVTIGSVLGTIDADDNDQGASGFFLSGGGQIDRINDPTKDFCPSCELTFAFGGIGIDLDGSFILTADSWLQVFVDDAINYDTSFDSAADAPTVVDGLVWLDATFTSAELRQNDTLDNGLLTSQATINGGLAADRFDPNQIKITGNATYDNLNFRYSSGANGQVFGNTVSEPSTIAMFSIALLGLASIYRRRA